MSTSTVQAKGQRFGVAQGVVKRFSGLPGERAPGGVGDGAGDHNRHEFVYADANRRY